MPSLPAAGARVRASDFSSIWPIGTDGTSYVPTLTQGVAVTFTTEFAVYVRVGGWVLANVSLSPTSAGTAGQPLVIGLPPVAPLAYRHVGMGSVYDASVTTYYSGAVFWLSATTCRIVPHAGNAGLGSVGFTAALAAGDLVMLHLMYRG